MMERHGGRARAVQGDLDPARPASVTAAIEPTACCRRWPGTRDPDLAGHRDTLGSTTSIHSCLTISTEISTAGIVPLFSSQWVVFRSSGQPTPGP
jgi:hypothetical protein